ncbi:MAG: 3-dehydroquinate synthase [Nitrososphaerales archaeon]
MATATLSISFERSREKCDIFVKDQILANLPSRQFSNLSSVIVISDDNVSKLYAERVRNGLSRRITSTGAITFPHGEKSKNLHTVSVIASKMSDLDADRNTAVLALGGGVVGDLVGFVCSVFKRGIKYFQAPTTLLAQVDSSIGGKTGVDAEWGKNQLGTFYQPTAVFIDPSTLDTLPRSEIINGLGEMIKSGIIADKNLFEQVKKIDFFSIHSLKPLIPQTCEIKAKIVRADEREANLRSVLNYGHTVGHAIEASSDYILGHGKCVILGMMAEGWISSKLGIFEESDYKKQTDLLKKVTQRFKVDFKTLDTKEILSFARLDKKSSRSSIRMALPERIGRMHMEKNGSFLVPVSKDLFVSSLEQLRREV